MLRRWYHTPTLKKTNQHRPYLCFALSNDFPKAKEDIGQCIAFETSTGRNGLTESGKRILGSWRCVNVIKRGWKRVPFDFHRPFIFNHLGISVAPLPSIISPLLSLSSLLLLLPLSLSLLKDEDKVCFSVHSRTISPCKAA